MSNSESKPAVPSSKDVEVRREILNPIVSNQVTQILQGKHDSDQRVIADRKDRESYTAPDGDTDIKQGGFQVQRGRPIQASEIIRRLRAINSALRFERSRNFPDLWGVYIIENRPDPITGSSPWKRHICGMPDGEVWEFHRPLVIDEEIPDVNGGVAKANKLEGHVPGWRQVLLRLVYDGAIKPADCEKHFQVSRGRSSAKWQLAKIN